MVIDSHCHAGKADGLTGPWDTAAPLGEYQRQADRAGIARTVIFACFHSNYRIANRQIARIVWRNPRYYGYAFVHAERDRDRMLELVGEAALHLGFVGIKVHRNDAPINRQVCDAARRFRMPVLYDVMGDIWAVDLLAAEYPDVNFIIPHLGSFADNWRAQQNFLYRLARFPNIHTDSSGVRRLDLLREAVTTAGPQKLLFGSDGPFLHAGHELQKIGQLNLSPADYGKVTAGNWLRMTAFPRYRAARIAACRRLRSDFSVGRCGVPAWGSHCDGVDPLIHDYSDVTW
jgi:predicted TIM-barrel fold metal-dependent hydrolase